MAAPIELIGSRTFGTERGGKKTAEMVFHVDAPQDVALQTPGLPQENDPFVSEPALLCDRRTAVYLSGSVARSIVTCYFSSDRSWRAAPHIDKLQAGYVEFEVDFIDVPEQLPVQVFTPKGRSFSVQDNQGQTSEKTIDIWDLQALSTITHMTAFQVQVVLNSLSLADVATIGTQNGRLHFIGGSWYRFKAGKIRRRDSAVYETLYTWTFDPGIESLPPALDPDDGTIAVDPPRKLKSALGIPAQFGWTRPPYETVRVRVSNTYDAANGVQDKHKFYSFLPAQQDAQGFKSLPGNPL